MIRIRSAALGVALIAASAAAVAAQAPEVRERARAGEMRQGGMRQGGHRGLMRGVELTEAQRTQIRAIRDKYRPQRQELQKAMRAARADQQRPDSATLQRWKELALRERTEVRGVLTADQQAIFDQNVKRVSERMQNREGKRTRGEGKRARGSRPARGA